MVELWFTFSLIWSICASVDENGRQKIDTFVREKDGNFPVKVSLKAISLANFISNILLNVSVGRTLYMRDATAKIT